MITERVYYYICCITMCTMCVGGCEAAGGCAICKQKDCQGATGIFV